MRGRKSLGYIDLLLLLLLLAITKWTSSLASHSVARALKGAGYGKWIEFSIFSSHTHVLGTREYKPLLFFVHPHYAQTPLHVKYAWQGEEEVVVGMVDT